MVIVLGAGAAWWTWGKLFPGDEIQIRKLLEQTANAASFGGKQSDLSRMAGAAGLAACFTTDTLVKIDAPGLPGNSIRGRSQIQQLAIVARQRV